MDQGTLDLFPTRRIKPFDGMAVTAGVWEEAHDYHRRRLATHELLWHGPGIVSGLNVIASDPPDSSVYILPGVAVDPHGHAIVLAEPLSYDIGAASGRLSFRLIHEESQPTASGGEEQAPLYVHSQFGFEARGDTPPAEGEAPAIPGVELARLWRQDRNAPLTNARNPEYPGLNEIDTRFRRHVVAAPPTAARLAVSYLGAASDQRHGHGLSLLARAVRRSGRLDAWVDDGIDLTSGLDSYALICLVGLAAFQLGRDEMNALYAYLKTGGALFIESCRQATGTGVPPADACFQDVLASLGIQLQEVPRNDPLLAEPYLFATPPAGLEDEGRLLAAGGVVFSTWDYGCLWQGERRDRPASRDEIRTAMEWGENLVAYAAARQAGANAR